MAGSRAGIVMAPKRPYVAGLALIWAMSRNRVIGRENALPWRLKSDLSHFKTITRGCAVIMGRKTWQSLGRPLPERLNIVMTRDANFSPAGCVVAHSLEEAIAAAGNSGDPSRSSPIVIGGAELYRLALPFATRLYVTLVDTWIAGDTRFPEFDWNAWKETSRQWHPADEANDYAMSFVTLDRQHV